MHKFLRIILQFFFCYNFFFLSGNFCSICVTLIYTYFREMEMDKIIQIPNNGMWLYKLKKRHFTKMSCKS